MRRIWLLAVLSGLGNWVLGQAIDNIASFRMVNADRFVRFHYENDYFTSSDYYYTQGMHLEIVSPYFRRFPLSKLLIMPRTHEGTIHGISIEHNGYSPTSIGHNEILYGDRPYAAALLLKTFAASHHPSRHFRITSSVTLGVIGPAAGGKEVQTTIHRWIKDDAPLGWQHQIQNDVVINYEAGLEKNLVRSGRKLLINTFSTVHAGTLTTKISSGFIVMFGKLNTALTSAFFDTDKGVAGRQQKYSFHLYAQPMLTLVGYDATLQGGVFNPSSPYTISAKEIERVTLQGNYGLIFQRRSIYLEYFQTILSKEFQTGLYHRWGGIRIGIKVQSPRFKVQG